MVQASVVPPGLRLLYILNPAVNCWAIIKCPSGTTA